MEVQLRQDHNIDRETSMFVEENEEEIRQTFVPRSTTKQTKWSVSVFKGKYEE